MPRPGRLGVLQEAVEQELHAEVVPRAAEEHRRDVSRSGPSPDRTAFRRGRASRFLPAACRAHSPASRSRDQRVLAGSRSPPGRGMRRRRRARTDAALRSAGRTRPGTRTPCRAASSSETRRCRAPAPAHRAARAGPSSGRSSLFMNVKIGMSRRRQTSKSLRVCVSMPLAASITITTASTAVSTR